MRKSFMVLLITSSLALHLSGCADEGKGRVASWDNVAISYDVQGEGEPALVFVHGWSCDKSYWRLQVPYFAKRHKVVTIDLGGHGESGIGRETWTMEAFGKDVAAVVEELELGRVRAFDGRACDYRSSAAAAGTRNRVGWGGYVSGPGERVHCGAN
jgi:pimeloyl-ACP methyl ester carboxylesterase